MATRSGSAMTSSGFNRRLACCCQLSLVVHDVLRLFWPFWFETCSEELLLLPPLATTIVPSPRRRLTCSAVNVSFTPKYIWVTLESKVCSCPSGKHFFNWPSD